MAELDKKIAGLEEQIEGYKAEYKIVSGAQGKSEIRQTIKSRTENLNRLLDEEKKSPPQGNFFSFLQSFFLFL